MLAPCLNATLTWVSVDIINHISRAKGTGLLVIPLFMNINCLPLFLMGPFFGNLLLTLKHVLLCERYIYMDIKLMCYMSLKRVGLSSLNTSLKIPSVFWYVSLHTMFGRNFFCSRRDLRNWASLQWSIAKYHKRHRQAQDKSKVAVFVVLYTIPKPKSADKGLKMSPQVKIIT